jgi:hypothetical protein
LDLSIGPQFPNVRKRRIHYMKTAQRFAVILFLLLAACSTTPAPDVSYDYDVGVDFAALKTYNWLPLAASSTEGEWIANRIKREVDTQLNAKGFTAVSEDPDFLITFMGRRKKGIKDERYYGEAPTYLKGALVVVFLDGGTKKQIWRGKAEGVLDPSPTPEERDRNIKRVITDMLSNFPPSP